jgi:hypothetical protein
MRTLIAFAAVAFIAAPISAAADVSADLVFCSKRTDKGERIACYDAAARVAARPQRAVPRPRDDTPMVSPTAAMAYVTKAPPAPELSSFDGFYTAFGGAYGWSTARPSLVTGAPSIFLSDSLILSGPSGIGAFGYNQTFGRLLIGIELDGRWGSEKASSFSMGNVGFNPSGPVSVTSTNDAGIHLAGRVGGFIGETLIYGKIGAGLSRFNDHYFGNSTGLSSTFCTATCDVLRTINGAVLSGSTETWLPSFVLGAGIERNWDRFFVRLGTEAEMVAAHSIAVNVTGPTGATIGGQSGNLNTAFWTVRAIAMAGIRF